jgi:hypothetical protein
VKIKLFIILISLLSIGIIAFAQDEAERELSDNPSGMPEGCTNQGIAFLNGQLILGSQTEPLSQQLYFVHNNSDYTQLVLSHPTNTSAGAEWTSRLDEGQWSAIVISGVSFNLTCFGRKPGAIGYVDCQSVLEVCSYPKAHTNIAGNYWIGENKSLFDILSSLKTRG